MFSVLRHINKTVRWCLVLLLVWCCTTHTEAQLNTNRLLSIGRNALYFEDYVLSIQYFNQIIRIKPYLSEPYYYRAIAKIQLEDYEGAEQDMNEALFRNPFLAGAFYARGFARKQQGKLAEAEEDFDKALEFSPDNLSVLLNRIELYERQEKYDDALREIDALLRRNEDVEMLGFERGRVLFMKGDTLGALQSFDALIAQDSISDEGWGMRALIHLQLGNRQLAMRDYNEAIRRNRYNANYYINRGILNYWEKNYNGALSDFDRAIDLEPGNRLTLFNRALLREEVGDYDRAIADLELVLRIAPDYYEAYLKRAQIYLTKGEWQGAERDFTTILLRYPNFVPAYYGRSTARQHLGMNQLAYLDLETAQRIERNKDKIKNDIATGAQYADEESVQNRTKRFDASGGADLAKNKYDNKARGSVQNQVADVVNERNFVVSYYASERSDVQRYYDVIAQLNRSGVFPGAMKITNKELPLTAASIDLHNQSINHFSQLIQDNPRSALLYFGRALDYSLTQDYNSAIENYSLAIDCDPNFAIAYFCRANMRYKQLERMVFDADDDLLVSDKAKDVRGGKPTSSQRLPQEKRYNYEFELMMRDFDRAAALAPDFEFVWYNKANLLCVLKDYTSAVQHYTKALEVNPDFAEAYFNRGLTQILLGNDREGLSDLSKAGELGLYQSYNLIKRLKK